MKTEETSKKRAVRKDRSYLQDKTPPTSLAMTVRYHLKPIPPKAIEADVSKKDRKMFYAKVVPWRTMNLEDLLERMDRERLPVNQHAARMVLLTAIDTIIRCLKEGNQVTIDNFLSFGLSIPGRVGFDFSKNPPEGLSEAALEAREKAKEELAADASVVRGELSVRPWVRCAPALIDAVNNGVQITHMGVTKPVAEGLITIPKRRRPRKTKPSTDDTPAS